MQADLYREFQQKGSIESIDVQTTEQLSGKNSSTDVTDMNRQVKDRFDNFNAQIVAIKANLMNKIYNLKNEVDRLKLKIKDQDNETLNHSTRGT